MKTILVAFCMMLSILAFASENKPHKVAILLFDDVQIIDFSAPWEVFGQAGFEVMTVSKTGEPITTVMGMSVNPEYSFKTVPQFDTLLIPGGSINEVAKDSKVLDWIRSVQDTTQHTLSVCTATYILAEAGLLDNKTATSFHRSLKHLEKKYPKINIVNDQRFTEDGKIMTSAGLSSGIDLALQYVAKIRGINVAKTVALGIEYDWDPKQGFVRGTMADFKYPDINLDLPDGIKMQREYSIGDQQQWQSKFTITGLTDVSALKNLTITAMQEHAAWQATETNSPETLWRWIKTDNGEQWQLQASLSQQKSDASWSLNWEITRL